MEGPSAEALSLGPRDRTKQSPGNAVQVFQRHGTLSGRRGLDDALGDRVIDVGLHPALPTGQVPQHPLGALGTLLLKAAPLPATASTGPVERRAGEHLPVAGGRKMDDAEIDAQHVCRRQWRRGIGQRQREGDAPPAFAVPEYVGLTDLLGLPQQPPLVPTDGQIADDAAVQCGQTHALKAVLRLQPIQALIVDNGGVRAEMPLRLAVELVGIGHDGDGSHGKLRQQAERGPQLIVDAMVQPHRIEDALLKGHGRGRVARRVEGGLGAGHLGHIVRRYPEGTRHGALHYPKYSRNRLTGKGGAHFLCPLKQAVSVREF